MDLKAIIYIVINLIQVATPIVVGIALITFFWAIFQSFGRLDTVEQRVDIRKTLVWSVIAIFVVVTLAGIVSIVSNTFSLGNAPAGGGGAGSGVLNQGTGGAGGSSFFPSARTLPFFRVGGPPQ